MNQMSFRSATAARRSKRALHLTGRVRKALKWAWVGLLYFSGLFRWARWRLKARGAVIVLTFHRVLPDSEFHNTMSPDGMVVRENTFRELAEYVSRRHSVVAIANGLPQSANGHSRLRLAFTFDDAWEDNARVAAPIARRHAIPLTIFVCPGHVNSTFPFWPERVAALCEAAQNSGSLDRLAQLVAAGAGRPVELLLQEGGKETAAATIEFLKTLPAELRCRIIGTLSAEFGNHPEIARSAPAHATMNWEAISQLAAEGVAFGSHGQSHEILPRIAPEQVGRELTVSKQELQERLQTPCTLFSYPNGTWSYDVRERVAAAGYRFAFLNRPGVWVRDGDPLLVPRVNVWEGMVAGPSGRFSRLAFEYATVWRAYRAPRLS
jgi:peptidoglycan/xylan/chitin deacetylase (PgdA/CDA1 family)